MVPNVYFVSVGTYNPHEQLVYETDCLPCSPGQFCNETGLSAVSGPCSAGYLCVANATSATPNDGVNGPCPVGHYCPSGELNMEDFLKLMFKFLDRFNFVVMHA